MDVLEGDIAGGHGVEAEAFTKVGGGHRHGGGQGDAGDPVGEALDLLGRDVLPGPVDHVLVAALDDV
ncbi:hypothetical protein [Actinomadura luteofluorescens]|uniref:hypothetical protein n=1 Tax=Actinomadura luteofluorescens TaxID=46163 RepID=UPI0021641423|nr:hypothetical protein [Actinomadura glauciflava]